MNNSNNNDRKWEEYYLTGTYKGFRKSKEYKYRLMGRTHLTFTDGHKDFFASGSFQEEALSKIFDRIDKYNKN